MKKKIAIEVIFAVLIIIQFFQPEKNQSKELPASDITKIMNVPQDVQEILKTSCYDCHSNNTVYPWYSNIQPLAWWLNNHVVEGKQHLNFSAFGDYTAKKAAKKLHEITEEIEEGEMPLSSYTLIHRNAVLDEKQKDLVISWAKSEEVAKAAN